MPYYLGLTPIQQLKLASSLGDNDHLKMMLAQGSVDVNTVFSYGCTALHNAAQSNHPEVVRTLLSNGAKINVFDSSGCSPLMLAIELGQQDAVDVLVQAGAEILAANLMIADCFHSKTDIDLRAKEYVENINFSAIARYTAAMGLVESSTRFDSPFDGNDGLESLMESMCSQLLAHDLPVPELIDLYQVSPALIGVDEAAPGFIG